MIKFASTSKENLSWHGTIFCGKCVFFAIGPSIVVSLRCNKRFVCEGGIPSGTPFRDRADFRVTRVSPGSHVWAFS